MCIQKMSLVKRAAMKIRTNKWLRNILGHHEIPEKLHCSLEFNASQFLQVSPGVAEQSASFLFNIQNILWDDLNNN